MGVGAQEAPIVNALTALMAMSNRMLEELDKRSSLSKAEKSAALTDGQSAEKRVQSMQVAINKLPLQDIT